MYKELAHAAVWSVRHLRGQLTPPELALLAPLIQRGDICLDIGAHAGSWLFPLGRLVGPAGRVIGFEALPYYARVLRATKAVVGTSNVSVLNNAVTEDGAPVRMIWQDPAGARLTGRTHIAGQGEKASAGIEIAGVTIDTVCAALAGRISFVKIDIEGAELGALRGGLATLRQHRPIVYSEVVEAHLNRYGHTTQRLFSFFSDIDYRALSVAEGKISSTTAADAAAFNDILFVPAESVEGLCRKAGAGSA
jgi:FkbM family methyltransferase